MTDAWIPDRYDFDTDSAVDRNGDPEPPPPPVDPARFVATMQRFLLDGGEDDYARLLSGCRLDPCIWNTYDSCVGLMLTIYGSRAAYDAISPDDSPGRQAWEKAAKAVMPRGFEMDGLVIRMEMVDSGGGALPVAPVDASQPKRYFSERHGRGPKAGPLSLDALRRLIFSVLDSFRERDYFQEAFGYYCVDAGEVAGTLGSDPGAYFLRTTLRENAWPYWEHGERWDSDTLFDMVEALHDLISKPIEGHYHSYSDCGWHYSKFNRSEGQAAYRSEMNAVLRLGDPGFQLDGLGQIIERGPEEFQTLLDAPVPAGTEHDLITARIDAAVKRFRSRGASLDDRRHAVRDLADVLEALRPDIKEHMLSKDEGALFDIANNFALRHHTRRQRGDYDKVTWLRWTFYVYLATIHAVLRVRSRQRET